MPSPEDIKLASFETQAVIVETLEAAVPGYAERREASLANSDVLVTTVPSGYSVIEVDDWMIVAPGEPIGEGDTLGNAILTYQGPDMSVPIQTGEKALPGVKSLITRFRSAKQPTE